MKAPCGGFRVWLGPLVVLSALNVTVAVAQPPWARDRVAGDAPGRADLALARGVPVTAATAGDGEWSDLFPPPERYGHTAIYDPVRDRMVVFAGEIDGPTTDVWVYSMAGSPAWTQLVPTGTPPSWRSGHTAIYDAVRDRMVVFGGWSGSAVNDVWSLSLDASPAWTQLAPAGSPPPGRRGHAAIYDPIRDRMVVFGGDDNSGASNDVWALSLDGSPSWTQLAPSGIPPSVRTGPMAIYDPVRDRMLTFGGWNGSVYFNDVKALSLAGSPAWSALAPSGGSPGARVGGHPIYDPVRDRMLVFGGWNGSFPLNDVRALSLAGSPAWSPIVPGGATPPARSGHTAIYDPVRDRMVVFAGFSISYLDDVWALSLAGSPAWALLSPTGSTPSARTGPSAIYDPVRDRMLMFGGIDGTSLRNDVWALVQAGGPAWALLAPTGSPPPPRNGHTAIYDPVRDRMVVFAGQASDPFGAIYVNDVWALSLAGSPAWTPLAPTGTPPPVRAGHTAIYDPVRDRMVVFGGDGATDVVNDVWALSLAGTPAWTQLTPTGIPPAPRSAPAIYDPVRDRMVILGGVGAHYCCGPIFNDVWELSLAGSPAWTQLAPAGGPPPLRSAHTAIYDPVRDRVVIWGGLDESYFVEDMWALALAGGTTWTSLAPVAGPPPPRYGHTAIYDPGLDRMVVFGGYSNGDRGDTWSLAMSTVVSVPPDPDAASSGFELAHPRPNPSRGEITVDFVLAEPDRVVIDVFSAQGRRVRRIADQSFPAGRHSTTWRGDDESGRAQESGVYFIRMRVGAHLATRRTVRIR